MHVRTAVQFVIFHACMRPTGSRCMVIIYSCSEHMEWHWSTYVVLIINPRPAVVICLTAGSCWAKNYWFGLGGLFCFNLLDHAYVPWRARWTRIGVTACTWGGHTYLLHPAMTTTYSRLFSFWPSQRDQQRATGRYGWENFSRSKHKWPATSNDISICWLAGSHYTDPPH